MESVKAEVSCSSANLGPGFDILGLSLDIFSESVTVKIEPGNNSAVEISPEAVLNSSASLTASLKSILANGVYSIGIPGFH